MRRANQKRFWDAKPEVLIERAAVMADLFLEDGSAAIIWDTRICGDSIGLQFFLFQYFYSVSFHEAEREEYSAALKAEL